MFSLHLSVWKMNATKVKDQSESLPGKILKRVYDRYLNVDNIPSGQE